MPLAPPSPSLAQEQSLPKPITMISGLYRNNEPEEKLSQLIVERLSEKLNLPIRLEKIPQGRGVAAASRITFSKPDGFTAALLPAEALVTRELLIASPYVRQEFKPVLITWHSLNVLIAHANAPFNNLNELAQTAKTRSVTLACEDLRTLTIPTFQALALQKDLNFLFTLVKFNELSPDSLISSQASDRQDTSDSAFTPAEVMAWPLWDLARRPDLAQFKIIAVLADRYQGQKANPALALSAQGLKTSVNDWVALVVSGKTPDKLSQINPAVLFEILKDDDIKTLMLQGELNPAALEPERTQSAWEEEFISQESLLGFLNLIKGN